MHLLVARVGFLAAALATASFAPAPAETSATPAPAKVAQAEPAPKPSPSPFTYSGFFRSYYFTRQNASNNPGTQFNFSPEPSTTRTA